MQTILGANGVIANGVARNLLQYTHQIRLVSRNPKKVNETDEIFPADLLDYEQSCNAVGNSEVAYLTAGLVYDIRVWKEQWPKLMQNVINACKKANCKLVFFDNVYMYGKVEGWMTEETPMNPCSRKGEVRAIIASMILDEVKKGNLTALIARAADFYGPNIPLSFVNTLVFENLKKGKKAQWMVNENTLHSFTYTPDAGKATAILGNTPGAFNQVWHVPTHRDALTGKEFIRLAAETYGTKPGSMVLSKGMIRMVGLFNHVVKESVEMLYQYKYDYLFSSSKFERAFDFKPMPYSEGIANSVKSLSF